jgi:outer membrane protein OmpA-like peptidoglycan-associated protein
MLKPFRHALTACCLATTTLGTVVSLPAAVADAQELVIFRDVPSVEELNSVLFGAPEEETAGPKTRSIRFHEAAPPAQPAPTQEPTTSAGDVASTAPMAPTPPPSGTALGLNILFEFNSTSVLPESIPYLQRLGEVLTLPENSTKVVSVVGHTDATGGAAYNQTLSEQRALAVGQYLVDTWAIDPNRLAIEGRGKSQPLAGTDPFDGINRRVEFYALE